MPSFGPESLVQRATLHPDLQRLFDRVVETWDCTILEGKRSEAQQIENVKNHVSRTLQSKHVYPLNEPSDAADVGPYPLRWPTPPKNKSAEEEKRWMKDVALFYYFGGYVLGIAEEMGIAIRHGADWDGDHNIQEQNFDDLVHFERDLG